MTSLLVLILLAVPLLELVVIFEVADRVGFLATIALLIGVSIAGAWLLKQQGLSTWRRVRATMNRGEMPSTELADGALILFGGALLLTPGFLTDALGLALLLPPSRKALKDVARRWIARWGKRRVGAGGIIAGEVIRSRRRPRPDKPPAREDRDDATRRPPGAPSSPSERPPLSGGGSPDKE